MGIPNYKLKAEVLSSDLWRNYNQIKKQDYFDRTTDGVLGTYSNWKLDQYLFGNSVLVDECEKIRNSQKQRIKRLNERVGSILLKGDCLFLTMTFKDEVLRDTSPKTRRRYIHYFLKSQETNGYVGNIDFGSDTEYTDRHGNIRLATKREHYHALIGASMVDIEQWKKYGHIKAERVRNNSISGDKVRLSKYIAKLSNHAIKETTQRSCLIYSRNTKK